MGKDNIRNYGLIGKNIDYSFSRGYFAEKFVTEQHTACRYDNYDCATIDDVINTLKRNDIAGLNVTIPYKEKIIPTLDSLSEQAKEIGAVNTILFHKDGRREGHNTDAYGFETALFNHWKPIINSKALILGTGGASKAIEYVLRKRGISPQFVSRIASNKAFCYDQLTPAQIKAHGLIINCTPLGTFPDVDKAPPIDYSALEEKHFLFDLIYNPKTTRFMTLGQKQGAKTINGMEMLVHQAERSWVLWNS